VQSFLSQLNIPRSCKVGNTIFKKTFYDQANLSPSDKKLFSEQIDKIIWQYCLKPDTINIQPFKDESKDYPEIEVISILLNNDAKTKRIAEIIMKNIPYPLLLVFSFDNKIQLCAAHQRQSLSDASKNTVDEFIFTNWFNVDKLNTQDELFLETIDFTKLSRLNFYKMYSDLVDKINIYNASKLMSDDYIANTSPNDAKDIYNKVTLLDNEIIQLKNKIKKESAVNEKVTMNIELNKLKTKRKELLAKID